MKKLIVLSAFLVGMPFHQITFAEGVVDLQEEENIYLSEENLIEEEDLDKQEAEEEEPQQQEANDSSLENEDVILEEETILEESADEETVGEENEDTPTTSSDKVKSNKQVTIQKVQTESVQTTNYVPQTAEEWLEYAASQSASSDRITMYLEGYNLYPNDNRFVAGIRSSVNSLLTWTKNQHQDGRFDVAIGRYQFILSLPELTENLVKETEIKLRYANAEQKVPTANQLVTIANQESSSSPKLERFIEGYYLYPNDARFESGINASARSLLNWAIKQHDEGNFEVAVGRYEFILAAPALLSNIRATTEEKLTEALQGERSADIILAQANKQSASSDRLALFIEGHTLYPNDARFTAGINASVRSLLTWSTNQHQDGRYDVAIGRYEYILSAPKLLDSLRIETETKLRFAQQNRKISTVNELIAIANAEPSSSPRLERFIEGAYIFPNESRIINGINSAAQSLLNWAKEKHNDGEYEVAIGRYELILSAPGLSNNIKTDTQNSLKDAKIGKRPANVIYQLALEQSASSDKITLFVEGYNFYPNDSRFKTGINDSARSLLNWAKNQHHEGNFDVAIGRYTFIINTPTVHGGVKTEAKNLRELARNETTPDRSVTKYTSYNLTINEAINRQLLLNPPPQTDLYRSAPGYIHSSLVDIVESGALTDSGVRLRTSPHLVDGNIKGTYNQGTTFTIVKEVTGDSTGGSNKWYEIILNGETLYVHTTLARKTQVAIVNSSANVRESANTSSHVYGSVARNRELVILKEVTGTSVSGSTKWYEITFDTWRNAKTSDFLDYIDPSKNDRMQHLELDKSVGVTASELNKILSGKGILHGLGQAFIDAGKTQSVNEIYLISHALLETGHGSSPLARGIEVGRNSSGNLVLVTSSNRSSLTNIRTTHNMFGIGANDGDAHRLGAIYAYNAGWFTPEAAIIGGAAFVSNSYFARGQNTLYKMRWNHAYPDSAGLHRQYATDMGWAVKQISSIKNLYDMLDNPVLRFDIVQYK